MIKCPWATSITRGKSERDMTNRVQRRKKGSLHPKNRSPAPRTRDGKTYPGGKLLRAATKRLSVRVAAFEALDSKQKAAATKPGSMQS